MNFGISGDVYGYYKDGQLVGFKSQADIDAAYQSGYTAGVAAGVTTHTGTYTITTNGTTDLGIHHTYRYIDTSVATSRPFEIIVFEEMNSGFVTYYNTQTNTGSWNGASNNPTMGNFKVTYSGGSNPLKLSPSGKDKLNCAFTVFISGPTTKIEWKTLSYSSAAVPICDASNVCRPLFVIHFLDNEAHF